MADRFVLGFKLGFSIGCSIGAGLVTGVLILSFIGGDPRATIFAGGLLTAIAAWDAAKELPE